ncbi:hypothetical protein V1511DRAFT_498357 [Dipodascopsis uninucleata]
MSATLESAATAALDEKSLGIRKNGKYWKETKQPKRIRSLGTKPITSWEKRLKERHLRQEILAAQKSLIDERRSQITERKERMKEAQRQKEEKERYEKMAEKMHRKRVERLKRREKRNKLLKER